MRHALIRTVLGRATVAIAACAVTVLVASRTQAATPTDLVIRATASSFKVGTIGSYRITVSNNGSAATDDTVHVLDTLAPGLSYFAGSGTGWSCSAHAASIDCALSLPLAVGQTSVLTLQVAVCTEAFPTVASALRMSYAADTNSANNVVRRFTAVRAGRCIAPTSTPASGGRPRRGTPTRTPAPTATPTPVSVPTDLLLKLTTAGLFRSGSTGTYNVSVINLGPLASGGPIIVVDTLPHGLHYHSFAGAGWSCAAVDQTVTCTTSGSIAVGASSALAVAVDIDSSAVPTVTNVAQLVYPADPLPFNNTARKPTTVR